MSAIYLTNSNCSLCSSIRQEEEKVLNIKSAINTIFRYCRISYQACTTFEDVNYKGFQTSQRINFDQLDGNRVNCFFVSNREKPSIFDHENIYGIFGVGRPDNDYKYQYATIEEMVTFYGLNYKLISVYFSQTGVVNLGKNFEYQGSIEMNTYEITDTSKYSFLVTDLMIGSSLNNTNALKLYSDFKFELNCNERYSAIDSRTLEKLIDQAVIILINGGLEKSIILKNAESLTISSSNLDQINSLFNFSISDNLDQSYPLRPFILKNTSQICNETAPCLYDFMFKPANGSFYLGNGFLHRRVLEIKPDSFKLSRETLAEVNFDSLPIASTRVGWSFLYNFFSAILTLLLLAKSCQGCTKTLGQIK